MVAADSQNPCQWCRYTTKLPDLSSDENIRRWCALERAKRQLLLQLSELGMPPYVDNIQNAHPLGFQFLEDTTDANGKTHTVYTGHAQGTITINIREADSVYREQQRVSFGEPQRTLIGHMRHEVGHYLQWCYVDHVAAESACKHFGDPNTVDYTTAKQQYYDSGPANDWPRSFVSAYATMHPWEDFAETVNVYLDLTAIAATANDQGLVSIDTSPRADARQLVQETLDIAVAVSEFNFDLGLSHLLPERLSDQVVRKIAFIHSLRKDANLADLSDYLNRARECGNVAGEHP